MQKNQTLTTNASVAFTNFDAHSTIELFHSLYSEIDDIDVCTAVREAYAHFVFYMGSESAQWYVQFIDCCRKLAETKGMGFGLFVRYIRTVDFISFRESFAEMTGNTHLIHLN